MMNLASPEQAFEKSFIPNEGVGLAREEFIINSYIKIHPLALLRYEDLADEILKRAIADMTVGYADKAEYFVDKLRRGRGHDRGRVLSQAGHRAPLGLQDQRVRQPDRGQAVRALGGKPHDRLARGLALLFQGIQGGLRPGVPGHAQDPRGNGADQRGGHDSLPAQRGRGAQGDSDHGRVRPAPGRERAQSHRHVRDPLQRDPGRGLPGGLRRLFHRHQRPDPAHPGRGPRLVAGGARVRRARRGRGR